MTTMPRGRQAAGAALLLGAILGAPSAARGDRCCFAACRPAFGGPMGLVVSCHEDDCPQSLGACIVWAYEEDGVRCEDGRGCPVGLHAEEGAEALVVRMVSDDDVVVTHEMAFVLRSGVLVLFRPHP